MDEARVGVTNPVVTFSPARRGRIESLSRASRAEFACTVAIPGTPALRATRRSRASGPRTSPTIRYSGRIRRDSRTRSRSVISPVPSAAAGRVCMATWSQLARPSSKTSSQEMTRRERGSSPASARRSVVLPACVPPETRTDSPTQTAAARKSRIGGGTMSTATRSSRVRAR